MLISVCLCTYQRPALLVAALRSVAAQVALPEHARIEVIVVDNDATGSARATVGTFGQAHPDLDLHYGIEPVPGISHARNKCLSLASGAWIAFLDDDESAEPRWLAQLLAATSTFDAQAVFGPVLPDFSAPPPAWMKHGGLLDRPRFPSGTPLGWGDARSGNVLFSRQLLEAGGRFDPQFARTGGEDSRFFAAALAAGFRLVWCDEACVHERVTLDRMTPTWAMKRAFQGGRTFARLDAAINGPSLFLKWSLHGALMAAALLLPVLVMCLVGRKDWFRYARKLAGSLGKLVAPFYTGGAYDH